MATALGQFMSTTSSPVGGGFQKEGDDADFGLVLKPNFWGHGHSIYRTAVAKGFLELGFESIVVTLPPSRKTFRLLERMGFIPDGETEHSGKRFLRFRLSKEVWARSSAASN